MMLMLILISVSSCNNEDENIGNIPSQLIKTWYMGETVYITFNADGTGIYAETDNVAQLMQKTSSRTTETYPFTYSYEESTQALAIYFEGKTMKWTIVTLTDDTLKIKDEEGNTLLLTTDVNPEPTIDINLLYKTWILEEERDLYTFNNDGSGEYKASENPSSIKLTYEYEAANRELLLHTDEKSFQWSILSLTNDTLKVEDNDGQTHTLIAYVNTSWSELLHGKWGFAGRTFMEFTNKEGNDLFTFYEEGKEPYPVPFKCDAYNRIYFFEEGSWSNGYWQIKDVTKDILALEQFSSEGETVYKNGAVTLFRVPEPDELVVGDESLLYGDEWTSFNIDQYGAYITLQFRKNSHEVIWTEGDTQLTAPYTYDATAHTLSINTNELVQTYKITKLTDHIMYLESIDEDGDSGYIEFRKL